MLITHLYIYFITYFHCLHIFILLTYLFIALVRENCRTTNYHF